MKLNKKYYWILFPVFALVIFKIVTDIDPIVTDSYTFIGNTEYLRPPLYPLLCKFFGTNIIYLQDILWLITAYIVFKKTDVLGLIIYCSTIGLLFLSQKILTETLFVFFITIAIIDKPRFFFWICLTLLIKPVMIFFILPILFFIAPGKWQLIAGSVMIVIGIYYAWFSSNWIGQHFWQENIIGGYLTNLGRNCIGKTVGVEGFMQRITQLQTLSYVILGFILAFNWRKNLLFLLPIYLILLSGVSPNQGDRYIIIIVPICLIFLYELYIKTELTPKEKESWKYSKKDYLIRKP